MYGLEKKNLKKRTKSYSLRMRTVSESFSLLVSLDISNSSPCMTALNYSSAEGKVVFLKRK